MFTTTTTTTAAAAAATTTTTTTTTAATTTAATTIAIEYVGRVRSAVDYYLRPLFRSTEKLHHEAVHLSAPVSAVAVRMRHVHIRPCEYNDPL